MDRLRRVQPWLVAMLALAVVLLPLVALAQNADGSAFNRDPLLGPPPSLNVQPGFGLNGAVGQMQGWIAGLQTVGLRLFISLAILEFVWVMVYSIIQGRPVFEVLGAFIPKMIGFSFFYWIMVENGYQTTQNIVSSFLQAGQAVGAPANIDTTALLLKGFEIAAPMFIYAIIMVLIPNYYAGFFYSFGFTNLLTPLVAVQLLGATLVIGSFTILAGIVALTTLEAYLVSVVGLLMAAFSALRITHPYGGTKMMSFAVAIGVKLMVVYLAVAFIQAAIVPTITADAAIPLLGALEAAFVSAITMIIAYNMSAFASGMVSGMAGAMAGAAMSATTSYMNQAASMARGMEQAAIGMNDEAQAQSMDQQYSQHSGAAHAGATENQSLAVAHTSMPGAPPSTSIAGEHLPPATTGAASMTSSTTQSGGTFGASHTENSPSSNGVQTASNGTGTTNGIASGPAPGPAHTADSHTHQSAAMQNLQATYERRANATTGEERKKLDDSIEQQRKDMSKEVGGGLWQTESTLLNITKQGAADSGVMAPQIRSTI